MAHVLIPCYHAVSEDWAADLSVTPSDFQAQVELLARRGYRGVTFAEAVRGPGDGDAVAITFDDAYTSVIDIAFPIMQRLGLRGTVFVPTAWADRPEPMEWQGIDHWKGGPHEHELHCMSWDQLRELAAAGWEIAAHTHTHPHLPEIDDERLDRELRQSREICEEKLGAPCPSIAYPYGEADARVVDAARRAGFSYGAMLKAIPDPEPLRWPRIGIWHGEPSWRWRLKLSPSVARLRTSRLGEAVDRVRGI